ncbi:MAG: substrate-binding domain-containing protein [Victivallales bacterium]
MIEPEEFRHVKAYDGILCGSDGLAYSVIKMAEQSGMKVPEDLMVSGILNTVWSSLFDYQISTIDQNPAELSRHVVRILEEGGRQSVTIEPDLILRNSTER